MTTPPPIPDRGITNKVTPPHIVTGDNEPVIDDKPQAVVEEVISEAVHTQASEEGAQTVIETVVEEVYAETAPDPVSSAIPPLPGTTPSGQPLPDKQMPPTYLVWNLLLCIACVITGVVGLIYASQVRQRWTAGDYDGALAASSNARLMILASCVLGLINIPFMLLYYAFT